MPKILRRITTVSAGLAVAAGVALAAAPSAAASGWGIRNNNDGLCLGIDQNSTAWGTRAVQWECNGNADQQWTFHSVDGGSSYTLTNDHGLCLGVDNGSRSWGLVQSSGGATATPTRSGSTAPSAAIRSASSTSIPACA